MRHGQSALAADRAEFGYGVRGYAKHSDFRLIGIGDKTAIKDIR